MFNLIVSSDESAWTRSTYALDRSRFCEYTPDPLKARYQDLDDRTIKELLSLPTLFAYEEPVGLPARVGKLSRIAEGSSRNIRIDFQFADEVDPIGADKLAELSMELDIVHFEMNRTHWAIKDIDLVEVLRSAKVIGTTSMADPTSNNPVSARFKATGIVVNPTAFRLPEEKQDPKLVSLMMPFLSEFDAVAVAVRSTCERLALDCERVDDVWKESTIIQEVFNLIFRSSIVVVDLSGGNSNVMYETGIAHTLGREVVPISRQNEELPFDIAHHRTLFYLNNGEGLTKMQASLERRLRSIVDHHKESA